MSVYIKGMEMPKSCWVCEVGGAAQMDNATCPFYSMEYWEQENYRDKIADGCPLVPVPSHGRLIDADTIGLTDFEIILCKQEKEPYKEALKMILDKIEKSPTIILKDQREAEE